MSDDSEQLLAKALRAQARQARNVSVQRPHPVRPDPPAVETPGGYGLLSGAEEGSLERERAALEVEAAPNPPPGHDNQALPIASSAASSARPAAASPAFSTRSSTIRVLLWAASLGLMSGATAGLFTLL